MRSAYVFSAVAAILLVAGLGLKLRLRGLNEGERIDVKAYIASLAPWNGFEADSIDQGDSQMDRLAIRAGACKVMIVMASPLGWHRDGVRRAAAADDKVFFLYRGRRYDDQPTWRTVTDHYLGRIGRIWGEAPPIRPVLGVIASTACQPERLMWLQFDRTIMGKDEAAHVPQH